MFTEPLPSNDKKDTQTDGRNMNQAAEMGSIALIYMHTKFSKNLFKVFKI
jgi:hypothetical protein